LNKIKDIELRLANLIRSCRKDLSGNENQVVDFILKAFTNKEIKNLDRERTASGNNKLEAFLVKELKSYSAPKKIESAFSTANVLRYCKQAIAAARSTRLAEYAEDIGQTVIDQIFTDDNRNKVENLHTEGRLGQYIARAARDQGNRKPVKKRESSDGLTMPEHLAYDKQIIKKSFRNKKTGEVIDLTELLDTTIISEVDEQQVRLDQARDNTNELVAKRAAKKDFTPEEGEAYTMWELCGYDKKLAVERYELDPKTLDRALDKVKRTCKRLMTDYREFPDYKNNPSAPIRVEKTKNVEYSEVQQEPSEKQLPFQLIDSAFRNDELHNKIEISD
jgi:hypothetical protein